MIHSNEHDRSVLRPTAPVFMTIGQLEQFTLDELYEMRQHAEKLQSEYPRHSIERIHLLGLLQNINIVILDILDRPMPLTKIERKYML